MIFIIMIIGCTKDVDPILEARKQLTSIGLKYNELEFVQRVILGDSLSVSLFLEAGMNPNTVVNLAKLPTKVQEQVFEHYGFPYEKESIKMPVLALARVFGQTEIVEMLWHKGASEIAANEADEAFKTSANMNAGPDRRFKELYKLLQLSEKRRAQEQLKLDR